MPKITIIYTYYGQKERIAGILAEKHPQTRIVIVDDCSPEALQSLKGVDVYRVDDDIAWNAGGATNLGFQESDGWIIYADIDHLVTKENIEQILKIRKSIGNIYAFGRDFERNGDAIFMIHKDDYEKVGGYDEDFSGNYGYVDVLFKDQCKKNLNFIERRDIVVKYFPESIITTLNRDENHNRVLYEIKRFCPRNITPRIRFKWHKV